MKRRRVEVNVGELDRLLDRERGKRRSAIRTTRRSRPRCMHWWMRWQSRATPRRAVRCWGRKEESGGQPEAGSNANQDQPSGSKPCGHGRNGADAFESAPKVETKHQQLKSGDSCPKCPNGKVYVLERAQGPDPDRRTKRPFRRPCITWNGCDAICAGRFSRAEAPEGVGPDKYDVETVGSMVAQLKYGSGMPFNRLEKLEQRLGVPLPATTQWEIVEEAAELLKPAHEELIRQGAQGEIFHNDDTSMKILKLERPDGDTRTGVFTSGIVSIRGSEQDCPVASHGRQHAGENLADVLEASGKRSGSAPMQRCAMHCRGMCRSYPPVRRHCWQTCLAHGRRQFVDVAENFS